MRVRLRIFTFTVFLLLPVLALAAHVRGFTVRAGQYAVAVGSAEMLISDSPGATIWYPTFGAAGSQPFSDYFVPRFERAGAIYTIAIPWISIIVLWGIVTCLSWGLTNPRKREPAFPLDMHHDRT
jgi:hypothetical protein